MAIDRIGKGSGLPPVPETAGTGAAAPTKTFEVDRGTRTEAIGAATPATPLERLRAGEIDVHGYIDLKVDEATAPLQGLSISELDEIKNMLRDQMKSDPGLADLVRTATGKMPTPPED